MIDRGNREAAVAFGKDDDEKMKNLGTASSMTLSSRVPFSKESSEQTEVQLGT